MEQPRRKPVQDKEIEGAAQMFLPSQGAAGGALQAISQKRGQSALGSLGGRTCVLMYLLLQGRFPATHSLTLKW